MTNFSRLTEKQFQKCIQSLEITLSEREYKLQLSSFKKLKKENLPYICNVDHIALLTGVSSKQLRLFIYNERKAYSSFRIPKKRGGFRTIDAPSKKMKKIQRWILDNILYNIDPGEYAHGFLPKKSITTNSSLHVGQDLVLGIDIKDFFPSITLNRVKGLIRSFGYNDEISNSLAEICTFNWRLPQGAPTSPMISNLIAKQLDDKLSRFCEKRKLNYSRYADDITISGGKNLPKFKEMIFDIIKRHEFSINFNKVRLHDRGSSQRVTGLIVNDKISIGRKRRKWLRAIVHNILKNGPVFENRTNNPFFKEWLFGHLGHAKMVEPDFATPLIKSIKDVDWSEYYILSKDSIISEMDFRVLKRVGTSPLIEFDKMGFFQNVGKISLEEHRDLLTQLNELKEKCKAHPTKEECMDCLCIKDESFEICMKYILAQFIGDTCGTHHGHEPYDIGGETDLFDENVFVAFLAKSGVDNTISRDNLFRQFFDCTDSGELDVISVVTPRDIDENLKLRLRRVMKHFSEDKHYCMILRKDMGRILHYFNRNYSVNR
ncbi:MAG: retron St85 family RNA-directed DNA polymerase [Spirochaetes bacterium]|nr:retron St85 family RNA-directed DNA polymerase [Spirochaetota bacterium]